MRLPLLLSLLTLGLAAQDRLMLEVRPPDHRFRFLPELRIPGQKPLVMALRGGSAKGLAHAGVMRRLDETGWALDGLVGTSAGSMASALYACGFGGVGAEALFAGQDFSRALDDRRRTQGLSLTEDEEIHGTLMGVSFAKGRLVMVPGEERARRLRILVMQALARGQVYAKDDFDRLGIPIRVVASSLTRGEARILSKGDLVDSVQASMSIPGLLAPVHLGGEQLVDGGLVENLPVMAARQAFPGAVVAGVHIGRSWDDTPAGDMLSLMNRSLDLTMRITEERSLASADVIARPDISALPDFDYKGLEGRLYDAGAKAMDAILPALEARVLPEGSDRPAAASLKVEVLSDPTLTAGHTGPWTRADFWRLLRRVHRTHPTGEAWVDLPAFPDGQAVLHWRPAPRIQRIELDIPGHWADSVKSEVARGVKEAGLEPGQPFDEMAFGRLEQRILAAGVLRGASVLDLRGSGFRDGVLRLAIVEPKVDRVIVEGSEPGLVEPLVQGLQGRIVRAEELEDTLGRARDRLGLRRLEARLDETPDGLALRLRPLGAKPTVLNLILAYESDWGMHTGLLLTGRNLLGSGVAGKVEVEADSLQRRAGAHFAWVPRSLPSLQLGAFGSWLRQDLLGGIMPSDDPSGGVDRRLVRREAGLEAVLRWGWEDRGRLGMALMVQDGSFGTEKQQVPTAGGGVVRLWGEWDDYDFHTLPDEGTSLRGTLDRSVRTGNVGRNYLRAYGQASRRQPLSEGWGLTLEGEAGLERDAPVDRWWVVGGSEAFMGTRSASLLLPNFVVLRLGLPYTRASLFGTGWQIGPRLDLGRSASTAGDLRTNPVMMTGYGMVARSAVRDFFLELSYGRVEARFAGTRAAENRAAILIGARPFDPWKRK